MTTVRTRFAPSPTGYMHIGGMRTALFNWLWAKHSGGTFILRIDDTDEIRNVEAALAPILNAFKWLGLPWDEGPETGGPHAPYFQSQRKHLYTAAAMKLLAEGKAYRDFSTPEESQADREAAQREKRPVLNVRRSLDLSPAEIERLVAEGKPHTIRFLVPRDEKVSIDDVVRGHVEWDCGTIPDPVLLRPNGTPLYNFATVVDDAAMDITHVIRAEEHLSNTPAQTMIHKALGNALPAFAHIPFVTAPGTTKKLSKRDIEKYKAMPVFKKMFERGDAVFSQIGLPDSTTLNPVMVDYYEKIGYLPDAVINALARLGWSLDDHTEIMSRETIVSNFTLDRVVKNPAGFDPDKLFSFQSHWMNALPADTKIDHCLPYLVKAGLIPLQSDNSIAPETRLFVGKVVAALGDRLKLFGDILDAGFFFRDELVYDEKTFQKRVKKEGVPELLREFRARLAATDDWSPANIEAILNAFAAERNEQPSTLIHALRLCVTGQGVGPGVYDCASLVGKDKSLARIDAALARTSESIGKPSAATRQDTCYMCNNLPTSVEHVPPRCFFPEQKDLAPGVNYRRNLITVPSCDVHNSDKSKDDIYLLSVVAAYFRNNQPAKDHYATKLLRALQKSPGLTHVVLERSEVVHLGSEPTRALNVDLERFMRELTHIACGLYYHTYKKQCPYPVQVHTSALHGPDKMERPEVVALIDAIRPLLESAPLCGENPGIFQYQVADLPNTPMTVIRMLFYQGMEALAIIAPGLIPASPTP